MHSASMVGDSMFLFGGIGDARILCNMCDACTVARADFRCAVGMCDVTVPRS